MVAGGECRDISELERLMSLKFQHLEDLIKDFMAKNQDEHKHFQKDIAELYNENKKIREDSAAGDIKTMTEMDAKLDTMSNRIGRIEESLIKTRTELEVKEKTGKSFMGVVALAITALTFALNYLLR